MTSNLFPAVLNDHGRRQQKPAALKPSTPPLPATRPFCQPDFKLKLKLLHNRLSFDDGLKTEGVPGYAGEQFSRLKGICHFLGIFIL